MAKEINNETFVNAGYKLASSLVHVDIQAGNSKRKLIMQVVEKYPHKEQLDFVVTGFEKYLHDQKASDATVRTRKSELMAIIKAALRGEHNVESLRDFQGSYHDWLTYARTLKGKRAEDEPHKERKPRTLRLTEKQEFKLKEKLTAANDNQLVSIVNDAIEALVAREDGEEEVKSILLVIQSQAELLVRTKKFSQEVHNLGGKILEIVVPALQEIEEETKEKEPVQEKGKEKLAA